MYNEDLMVIASQFQNAKEIDNKQDLEPNVYGKTSGNRSPLRKAPADDMEYKAL